MEVSCPTSAERVNETIVRLIAFMVMLIAIYSALFLSFYAMLFLMLDFAIRAFSTGKYSPLKFFAISLGKLLSLKEKMTDLAPKKFAATLGFLFCLVINICYKFNFLYLALGLTLILLIFAILESVFAICIGCHVYSFWRKLSQKEN